MDHPICADLCRGSGVVIVNADYRLAPEYGFPIPTNDGYSALKWVCLWD